MQMPVRARLPEPCPAPARSGQAGVRQTGLNNHDRLSE
jgi:hypothetical protein